MFIHIDSVCHIKIMLMGAVKQRR